MEVLSYETEKVLLVRLGGEGGAAATLFHFGRTEKNVTVAWPSGTWLKELDSAETRWGGVGGSVPPIVNGSEEIPLTLAPHSILLFVSRKET